MRPAWAAAEALARCTCRVEEAGEKGWQSRGTAFFVTNQLLLTCAHVVGAGNYRIVWYGPSRDGQSKLNEIPVEVVHRYPDVPAGPGPYPPPDVAVLRIPDADRDLVKCAAWLDAAEPGDDLWAFGFTEEYRLGQALGHPVRFRSAGPAGVAAGGAERVWRMIGDRVRGGLSGSPVLDLSTGRVVGIVKRTQDTKLPLGGYCAWMRDVLPHIPEIKAANEALNSDPARNDDVARELWGALITRAAAALSQNLLARKELARELQVPAGELSGDEADQARMLARRLFLLDLGQLRRVINGLDDTLGNRAAVDILDAVASCTTYEGEPWIAPETAAELAAQVELLADTAATAGRLLYLRTKTPMWPLYIQRANRNNTLSKKRLECSPFSHEIDEVTGLPKDLEYAMRDAIIRQFPGAPEGPQLAQPILDEQGRARWAEVSQEWLRQLRESCVIALLPPGTPLDEQFVERLVQDYPLVLVTVDPGNPPELSDRADYQMLEPDVDGKLADRAFIAYDNLRASLAGPRNGN
jgi:Trypsin-like peptidase domain